MGKITYRCSTKLLFRGLDRISEPGPIYIYMYIYIYIYVYGLSSTLLLFLFSFSTMCPALGMRGRRLKSHQLSTNKDVKKDENTIWYIMK